MPYTAPSDASPKLQVFEKYINAMAAIDIPTIVSCYDDALEMRVLPKSLGIPQMDKTQAEAFARGGMGSRFDSIEIFVHDVVEAADALTVHASNDGTSKLGTHMKQEAIFIMHFTPGDAPKIVKYVEFVNTTVLGEFIAAEKAAEAKNKAE